MKEQILRGQLKWFIKDSDMSQEQFAKMAGIPQSTLNKIINGKCDPKFSVVLKIIKTISGILYKTL